MAKAKVKVINETGIRENHRADRNTYRQMFEELTEGLREAGLGLLVEEDSLGSGFSYIFYQPKNRATKTKRRNIVEIWPTYALCGIDNTNVFDELVAKVHDEKAFEVVKNITEKYSDKFKHIDKIRIHTYF